MARNRQKKRNIPEHRENNRRRWRFSFTALIPAVCGFVGLCLFLYPSVASWLTQVNQSKVIASYSESIDTVQPEASVQVATAHEYNSALLSGAVYEAKSNVPVGDGVSTNSQLNYNDLLNVNGAGLMGRLRIPTIDLDLPIYHGTDELTLEKGLGHLEGTSLPVGGIGTRTVITGHRGMANALMFTNLDKVKEGDTFTLEVFNEVLTYRVFDVKVVNPDENESLRFDPNKDLATLVTCTPLGINTHRILVTGERITPTPLKDVEEAGKEPTIPGFPFWALWLTFGIIVAVTYVWRAGYEKMPKNAAAATTQRKETRRTRTRGFLRRNKKNRSDETQPGSTGETDDTTQLVEEKTQSSEETAVDETNTDKEEPATLEPTTLEQATNARVGDSDTNTPSTPQTSGT